MKTFSILPVLLTVCHLSLSAVLKGPTGNCDPAMCKPPNCRCPGTDIPGGLSRDETPQIIMLTFDDGINAKNMEYYHTLFGFGRHANLYNPNNCPIRSTFFVPDVGNNYNLTSEIYQQGHDIAAHSMTHKFPISYWKNLTYDQYKYEINGNIDRLVQLSNIPRYKIKGFRVPFLEVGGNLQYDVMRDLGLTWDSSMVTGSLNVNDDAPIWPFTLDYPPEKKYCATGTRPSKSFPGFWEVPLIRFYGLDGKPCSMGGMCTQPNSTIYTATYLWKNLNRHYSTNRAPMGIFIHSYWFDRERYNLVALRQFLENLKWTHNIWVVTVNQALDWIRNPTPITKLSNLQSWQC